MPFNFIFLQIPSEYSQVLLGRSAKDSFYIQASVYWIYIRLPLGK